MNAKISFHQTDMCEILNHMLVKKRFVTAQCNDDYKRKRETVEEGVRERARERMRQYRHLSGRRR